MKNALGARTARLTAIVLALGLSACSVLPKSPPVTTYQLPPRAVAPVQVGVAEGRQLGILRVLTPQSSRVLDSDRIVIARPDGRLAAWRGLRWTDPAPALLRDRLVETFMRDARTTGVANDGEAIAAALELHGTLRAFQLEQRGPASLVVIRFDARLVERGRLDVIASQPFESVQVTDSTRESDVVAAFGSAADVIAGQIVEWVVQAAQASEHAAGAGVNDRRMP